MRNAAFSAVHLVVCEITSCTVLVSQAHSRPTDSRSPKFLARGDPACCVAVNAMGIEIWIGQIFDTWKTLYAFSSEWHDRLLNVKSMRLFFDEYMARLDLREVRSITGSARGPTKNALGEVSWLKPENHERHIYTT